MVVVMMMVIKLKETEHTVIYSRPNKKKQKRRTDIAKREDRQHRMRRGTQLTSAV